MAEQLGFDLPGVPALGRADFMVAPSNAMAVSLIENWQNWPDGKLLLCGPEGSGKTHLTHVWAAQSDAAVVEASDLATADIPALIQRPVAIEDVPDLAGNRVAQTALFHLHNLAIAERQPLLLTGVGEPTRWPIDLPDLASRIGGTQTASLQAPDDALLTAVLAKLFTDRQIAVKPQFLSYLTRRIDRSFASAREVVALLDAASLAQKRPLTRAFARTVLDKHPTDGR